ncbi:hypothetical protein C2G38_2104903 [Gigaspora rosea]|uniref:Uncharacterized protein n=1 Tax=Gigaspora rosea TaxID=44941 RepID=A0A397UQ63_9GLOM|nr:hypothetical protein C2G38_2104903 [Gigaspora rosea]
MLSKRQNILSSLRWKLKILPGFYSTVNLHNPYVIKFLIKILRSVYNCLITVLLPKG